MRAPLRVLAIAGVLTISAALCPALAQSEASAAADPAQPAPAAAGVPAQLAPSSAAVPAGDVKKALTEMHSAWRNFNGCDRQNLCGVYFDTFGVALTFNDGTITPFSHLRRRTLSPHDCIINAREALDHGDRGLAVQWVMAAKAEEVAVRTWMSDHPDAVVAALHECC